MATTPTQVLSHLPLTTLFTPSPSCFSEYHAVPPRGYLQFGPEDLSSASQCQPSGWVTNAGDQYFSPGICPVGYTIACTSLNILDTLTETQATCCPTGYSCQLDAVRSASRYPWFASFQCAKAASDFVSSIITITATSDTLAYLITSTMTSGGVNAYGVSIRFQARDFATATPTPSTLTHSTSEPTASLPASTSSSTAQPHKPVTLSTGAKAGIGVAVVLFVITLGVLGTLCFNRRRRSRSMLPYVPPVELGPSAHDFSGAYQKPHHDSVRAEFFELPGEGRNK